MSMQRVQTLEVAPIARVVMIVCGMLTIVPVIKITMLIIRENVMILISGKHFNAQHVLMENKVQIRGVKVIP